MTSRAFYVILGLVLLLLVAVACGAPSVEQPVPANSASAPAPLAASVTEYVIFNDALSDPQAIANWYNSLPGSTYRGRVIDRIKSITAYHIYGQMNRDVFALVEFGPVR